MTARDILAAYEERINRHDFDLLVDLIAADAVFWFSDGSHHGIDAIRTAFEKTWAQLRDEHYWLDLHHVIAESSLAAAFTYRFNWRATVDGRPLAGAGRGTTVLACREGRW